MSSKTNPYLISICIPTFNRSDILYQNLPRLLSLQAFDHEVELVISDNASTDNTKAAIEQLKAEFPDKNISYYRNDENIRDRNFLLALSRGKGHYLKLLNDYTSFSNDDLIYMKEKVRVHQNDPDFCLFFFVFFYGRLVFVGRSVGSKSLFLFLFTLQLLLSLSGKVFLNAGDLVQSFLYARFGRNDPADKWFDFVVDKRPYLSSNKIDIF